MTSPPPKLLSDEKTVVDTIVATFDVSFYQDPNDAFGGGYGGGGESLPRQPDTKVFDEFDFYYGLSSLSNN